MRLIACLFLLSVPAWATCTSPCVHDSAIGAATGNNTVTITASTAGNILVLFFGGSTGATQTVSSIAGASFVKLTSSNTQRGHEIWCANNVAAGITSIVVTTSSGSIADQAEVTEFTGYNCTLSGSAGTNSGTVTNIVSGTTTTVDANTLLLGGTRQNGSNGTIQSSFTQLQSIVSIENGYRVVSSTGTYSVGWNGTGASNWDCEVAAVKQINAAGAAGRLLGFGQ